MQRFSLHRHPPRGGKSTVNVITGFGNDQVCQTSLHGCKQYKILNGTTTTYSLLSLYTLVDTPLESWLSTEKRLLVCSYPLAARGCKRLHGFPVQRLCSRLQRHAASCSEPGRTGLWTNNRLPPETAYRLTLSKTHTCREVEENAKKSRVWKLFCPTLRQLRPQLIRNLTNCARNLPNYMPIISITGRNGADKARGLRAPMSTNCIVCSARLFANSFQSRRP